MEEIRNIAPGLKIFPSHLRKTSLDLSDEEKMIPSPWGGLSKTQREVKAAKEELEAAKKDMEAAAAKIVSQEEKLLQYSKRENDFTEKLHEADVEAAGLRRQLAAQATNLEETSRGWRESYQALQNILQQEKEGATAAIRNLEWHLRQKDAEISVLRAAVRSVGISMETVTRAI